MGKSSELIFERTTVNVGNTGMVYRYINDKFESTVHKPLNQ